MTAMTAWFFKFPHTPSLGGGEFFSLRIAQVLRKGGYAVRLITSDQRLLRLFEKHGLPRRREYGFFRKCIDLAGWPPAGCR